MTIALSFLGLAAALIGTCVALILGQPLWIALVLGVVTGQAATLLLFVALLLRTKRDLAVQDDDVDPSGAMLTEKSSSPRAVSRQPVEIRT